MRDWIRSRALWTLAFLAIAGPPPTVQAASGSLTVGAPLPAPAATVREGPPPVVMCVPCEIDQPGEPPLVDALTLKLGPTDPLDPEEDGWVVSLYLQIGHSIHPLVGEELEEILGAVSQGGLEDLNLLEIDPHHEPGMHLSVWFGLAKDVDGTITYSWEQRTISSCYEGVVTAIGSWAIVPPSGWYLTSAEGAHEATLEATSGGLDLRLDRWDPAALSWELVDGGTGSATEVHHISQEPGSNYYRWWVDGASGAGSFRFCESHPY